MRRQRRRLFEDIKRTTVIDGFELGTDNDYTLTEDWVREKLKVFNDKYFEGKIKVDELPIDVSKKDYVGFFRGITKYDPTTGEVLGVRNYVLEIADNIFRSEVVFAEILLHEMIHIYNSTILKQVNIDPITHAVDSHGQLFLNKMKEINSHGWHLDTEESDEQFKNRGAINLESIKRFEEINDVSKYTIIFYIPKWYYSNPPNSREKVFFQVLKLSEWEGKDPKEILFIMKNSLAGTCRFTNTSYIRKGGDFSKWMEIGNFFKDTNRICAEEFLEKEYSKENISSNGKVIRDYLTSKTFQFSYEYFINFIQNKEFFLVSEEIISDLYNNKLSESLKDKSDEEIIKDLERSTYIKVFSIKREGSILEVDGLMM